MMRLLSNVAIGVLLTLAGAVVPAQAQYADPAKRVTLVVPFSAGGSNDILARAIGQKLSDAWQIPVIVDNQVGASGSLGAARVARTAPDGYTLLILSSTYTINSAVTPNLPFDPRTSFSPVALLGQAPFLPATSKRLPVANSRAPISLAPAKPR